MRKYDPAHDGELADALRQLDPPAATQAQLAGLARRIVRKAEPLLHARRESSSWWEYMAAWAGTLLPLGVATAVAAIAGIMWSASDSIPEPPPPPEPSALILAVTGRDQSRELLESILKPATVAPAPRQARSGR
jgi:hypothetical protein